MKFPAHSTTLILFILTLSFCTVGHAENVPTASKSVEGKATKLWRNARPSQVKLGGEMGRRIDITIDSHLLKLDLDQKWLAPYRAKQRNYGFVGLGMLLDSVVGFADYRRF